MVAACMPESDPARVANAGSRPAQDCPVRKRGVVGGISPMGEHRLAILRR